MYFRKSIRLFALLTVAALAAAAGQAPRRPRSRARAAIQKALEYSKSNNGLSLLILQKGKLLFEDYHNGYSKDDTHMLASATKSFSGVLLAALVEDKIVSSFDEKVSLTISEWAADPAKANITLRQLLNLTSGIDPGPIGRIVPYVQALQAKVVDAPGTIFQYGPVPLPGFRRSSKTQTQEGNGHRISEPPPIPAHRPGYARLALRPRQ